MTIKNSEDEMNLQISASVDLNEIQQPLDFIRYKEIASKSMGTQQDADTLARQVNKAWWAENKSKYITVN